MTPTYDERIRTGKRYSGLSECKSFFGCCKLMLLVPTQKLDDVSTYQLITKALIEKGYSEKDINKILGGNILRVLKANEVK